MTVTYYSSLETLAATEQRNASWWASVARALDDLNDRLVQAVAVDYGPGGAIGESVSRQPSLANDAARLRLDPMRLADRVHRLRRLVAEVAGDTLQAPAVATELSTLASIGDRLAQRSRSIFWDSFTRDIGDE